MSFSNRLLIRLIKRLFSSKKKNHQLVKHVRADIIKEAVYSQVRVEPRLDATRSQRRADIFNVDPPRGGTKEIHYYTDDTGGHPLCKTRFPLEQTDHLRTIHDLEQAKAASYDAIIDIARTASAVRSGLRSVVYRTCAFTSLGDLGKGMTSCINGAAGFLKQRELADSLRSPRSDGLEPQIVAGRFRFLARARIQAAILSGNAIIARFAGI